MSKHFGKVEKGPASPRLWVISEVYYPEVISTGYYLTAIAEGLVDYFDVKVICGQPNYSARGMRAPKRQKHKNVDIYRTAGTTFNKNAMGLKLINMVTLTLSMLFKGLMHFRRGDKVLVVTTPPTIPFAVAVASLFRGASYTLLIHDCYPEVLVAVGKLKRGSLIVRAIDFFNRWLYKHARKIIVVGRDMKELLSVKSRGLDVPIDIIQNWAELNDVRPENRSNNKLIKELQVEDKLIILHAGNIGYPTDVDTIIGVMKRLNRDSRFHFVFIGSGVKRKHLVKAIKDFELSNLTLLDPRPREEQIDFLNACDVGLVSLVPGMFGAAMPSKTYNIMAAGKPVLALTDENSELARVLDESGIGWHLVPGNIDLLEATLVKIHSQKDELECLGRKARQVAEKQYSAAIAIEHYRLALS